MCLEPDSLSSALACPLDLGARPTCRGLRAPLYANYQGIPQGELCPRDLGLFCFPFSTSFSTADVTGILPD